MLQKLSVIAFRTAVVVAICASSALVIEYVNAGDPAFCGVDSACFKVRTSSFAGDFFDTTGFTLPQLGLGAYLVLLGASLLSKGRAMQLFIAVVSCMGAAGAIGLLVLQGTTIGAFCKWCVTVDVAAIIAAICSIIVARSARTPAGLAGLEAQSAPGITFIWGLVGTVATAMPFVWANYVSPPQLPAQIAELQSKDKVTVVTFTDFECPFCRRLHEDFQAMKEKYPGQFEVQRKMVPLAGHFGAKPAAQGYLCTPPEHREEMAHKLYTGESYQLAAGGVEFALQLGQVDVTSLSTKADKVREHKICMQSDEVNAQIDADNALFDSIEARGLPATYVGKHLVLGYQPDKLRAAFAAEIEGKSFSMPLWAMLAVVGGVLAVAIGYSMKATPAEAPPARKRREDDDAKDDDDGDDDAEQDDGADDDDEAPPSSDGAKADSSDADEEGDGDDDDASHATQKKKPRKRRKRS